jgi:hypothetical protein
MSATVPSSRTSTVISHSGRAKLRANNVPAVTERLAASVLRRPNLSVKYPPTGCDSSPPNPHTVSTSPAVCTDTCRGPVR